MLLQGLGVWHPHPSGQSSTGPGCVLRGRTHLSRQATLRHFSGAKRGGDEGARPPASVGAVAEVGAGSLSRRMESMRAVGDKGVSTEDGCLGLASSTRGVRGGLGGLLLDTHQWAAGQGPGHVGGHVSRNLGGLHSLPTPSWAHRGWPSEATGGLRGTQPHLSSMLLPGEAKGLVGASSVMSEIMGPEVVTTSGA